MEQIAHQAIVMQFILDLARTLKVDPRGCFRDFFSKIKVCASQRLSTPFYYYSQQIYWLKLSICSSQTADKPYLDMFDHELELLKERVRSCAQSRMDSAMKEMEEEERQKRLGPGGLDPVVVYESLPKVNHTHAHSHTHKCKHVSMHGYKL